MGRSQHQDNQKTQVWSAERAVLPGTMLAIGGQGNCDTLRSVNREEIQISCQTDQVKQQASKARDR